MPIHRIEQIDQDTWRVWRSSSKYFDVVATVADGSEAKALVATEWAQANIFDNRTLLRDLPLDDPARLADPGQPYLFWDGDGSINTTYLVSRPIEVVITWIAEESRYEPTFRSLI